jgi:hypothetical protein
MLAFSLLVDQALRRRFGEVFVRHLRKAEKTCYSLPLCRGVEQSGSSLGS